MYWRKKYRKISLYNEKCYRESVPVPKAKVARKEHEEESSHESSSTSLEYAETCPEMELEAHCSKQLFKEKVDISLATFNISPVKTRKCTYNFKMPTYSIYAFSLVLKL